MKTNLLTILFLSLAVSASAQWSAGITAGTVLSNYKTKTPWKEAANTGFNFGATVRKQINVNYGFAADLQYIQKGYYHKICNTIFDKLKGNYIEIPIRIDYAFIIPSLKNFKGHANLGIYTAYWLSAKYETKGFDTASESFDFKHNKTSRFDIGPGIGGGIEYLLTKGSIALDVRYERGLIDLQKKANDDTSNTNRALIIGITYLMPLGK
jgi:hypothetical protein